MATHLRQHFEPLFVHYKVDLALWGHEHAYERMHPVVNGTTVSWTTTNPPAPINLVLGMGGADNSYMAGWIEPPPVNFKLFQIMNRPPLFFFKHGAKSGFEMCFAPSSFGAGGPNQNTSRIQHKEV